MKLKLFLLLFVLREAVPYTSVGIFKYVRKAIENLSASICYRLRNPRDVASMSKLNEDILRLRNEMRHIKNKVLNGMPYLTDVCVEIHKNNSYTYCEFYDMDMEGFKSKFNLGPLQFLPVHAYLREANRCLLYTSRCV